MSNPPNAIRLAEQLDRLYDQLDPVDDWRPHVSDAGDELRRVSALNAELVNGLKHLYSNAQKGGINRGQALDLALALIAKAEGGAA